MKKVHGVDGNADLDPALIRRETRPLRYRVKDSITENGGAFVVLLSIISFMLPFSESFWQVSDLILVIGGLFAAYAFSNRKTYLFRDPISEDIRNANSDAGIFCLGNDLNSNVGLWSSDSDLRTHLLVFGSTGSGKSVFLLGLLYQALLVGSGVLFVDGKADNGIFWLVYSLVRRLDRTDDFLVINYLLGDPTVNDGETTIGRLSNTTNPFAHGTAEQLRSLVVGLMRESAGDGELWKGRASAMLNGLLKALCHMRDKEEINLDIAKIRHNMPLERIIELSQRTDLPESAISPIRAYLAELPGYTEEDAIMGQLAQKCYEQHGYLTMQLTEVMSDLSDTYGHIFSVPLGEVDFQDVIFQRRILFVMLPALQADPDRLAGLGKMVVAGIRSALSPALGPKLEGTRREVIETKPTNSKVPFLMIFDEYGYYSVKGFAVVAAQARGLGVSCVFAGQDYPSFKKGGEDEAASTVANTNLKCILKLEDAQETCDIMVARGGEAHVALTYGHDRPKNEQLSTGYVDKGETRIEKQSRIDVRDLVNQKPGQAHVIFGDKISRCQLFYVRPNEVYEARLNKFIMVEGPSKQRRDTLKGTFDNLNLLFSGADLSLVRENQNKKITKKSSVKEVIEDQVLINMIGDYNYAVERNQSGAISSMYAVGMLEYRERLKDIDIEIKSGLKTIPVSTDKTATAGTASAPEAAINLKKGDDTGELVNETGLAEAQGILEILDGSEIEASIKIQAESIEKSFSKALEQSVLSTLAARSGRPLSAKQQSDAKPSNQIKAISIELGESETGANASAEKVIETLKNKALYPARPTPKKLTQDEITNAVGSLLRKIDEHKHI